MNSLSARGAGLTAPWWQLINWSKGVCGFVFRGGIIHYRRFCCIFQPDRRSAQQRWCLRHFSLSKSEWMGYQSLRPWFNIPRYKQYGIAHLINVQHLIDLGAAVATSPRAAAESSDVVIAMMATPAMGNSLTVQL